MSLDTGERLGRYEILGPIGAGGMGEVYRARDSELDRDVAIKVLPEAVSQNPDRLARFKREAKSLAALNHPNITTIFSFESAEPRPPVIPSERRPAGPELVEESGRVEGPHPDPSTSASLRAASAQDDTGMRAAAVGEVNFLVMELLEGQTLRERLGSGPLGGQRTAEIGAAIADGLAAAHRAGIVHRDLKPSNIFVTSDDRIKILDFGLARSLELEAADQSASPTQSYLTDPGSVFGTVGYMSPEQVRGEATDHRGDIFALGCVLYEMVCGRRAFLRDTAAETMTAILKEEPADLHSLSGDLSPVLADVVGRCLEKRPEARFQTGQDLAFALRSTLRESSGPVIQPTPEEKSIVVLPFENLSPDPDQEYFADGLTEEIISDLAKVRAMRVISRTSAMQLKGTDKDLKTIGREINVRYVLEGSVRRAGNNLRITAQLIDAVTDIHLWAEKYTGTLDDVFDIQETVSRTIVDALKVELTPQEDRRIADRATENVDVFECYHRAHSDLQTWSLPGIQRARVDLEKGLETFGEHADLYFELGHAHVMAYDLGIEPTAETLQRAEECAKKGLQLGPESPNSHYLFGMIERSRGNTIQAIRYLERFLAMEPDSSDGLFWLGTMYTFAGRTGAGLRMARRLLQVDPLYARTHLALGLAYQADGKIEPALAAMEKNAFLEPESATPPFWIAITLLQNNELQKASDLIDKFAPSVDKLERHFVEIALFARHAVRQEKDRAYSVLSDATRRFLWADPYLPWMVAGFFAVLGEHDESIRWLERLIELGFFNYPLLAEIDPTYESIRGDDRFQRLMNEIKPKWESFEVGLDLSRYPPPSDAP